MKRIKEWVLCLIIIFMIMPSNVWALSADKTWQDGEVLTADDLNNEFTNNREEIEVNRDKIGGADVFGYGTEGHDHEGSGEGVNLLIDAMADDNWGFFTITSHVAAMNDASIDGDAIANDAVDPNKMADGDYGAFTITSNVSVLDANSVSNDAIANDAVDPNKMADGDYGAFTITSNVSVLDANSVSTSQIVDSSVATTDLHTATGSASASLSASSSVDITMEDYCFFPSLTENGNGDINFYAKPATDPSNTTAVIRLHNPDGANATTYTVRWRYITATDKPFIYALVDKVTGELSALWECEDPPPGYWGMSEKPENFVPPILGPDLTKYDEIVVFNYPLKEFHNLRKEAKGKGKSMFNLLKEEYTINNTSKRFTKKNLHQGG